MSTRRLRDPEGVGHPAPREGFGKTLREGDDVEGHLGGKTMREGIGGGKTLREGIGHPAPREGFGGKTLREDDDDVEGHGGLRTKGE